MPGDITYPPEMLPSPDDGEEADVIVNGIAITREAIEAGISELHDCDLEHDPYEQIVRQVLCGAVAKMHAVDR
jgi:hypothetical protein